jgi:hypothetical protein
MFAGRSGRLRVAGVVIACCVGLGLLGTGSALAFEGVEKDFFFTDAEQQFKVPRGVTSVKVEAVGQSGEEGGCCTHAPGGKGAVVRGELPVTPEQVLYVEVGGTVGEFPPISFNGGGKGDGLFGTGGGASDVRTVSIGSEPSPGNKASLESRVLVAAGGGGGGDTDELEFTCPGGAGGNAEEKGANGSNCGFTPGEGGGAGKATEGGAGGKGYSEAKENSEWFGGPGALGRGGNTALIGGGGGGGLYGGGGGGTQDNAQPHGALAGQGGGGGGSNLVPPGGEAGPAETGPKVKITYVPPPCTTAVGKGSYLKLGETGRLNLSNVLSTNLAEPQKLLVSKNTGEVRFRLTKLESATCAGFAFAGEGQAVKGTEGGYHLTFRLYEEGTGKFFFESHLFKGALEVEASGGPLKTSATASEKIS